jgi:hypothetical protein
MWEAVAYKETLPVRLRDIERSCAMQAEVSEGERKAADMLRGGKERGRT